MVFQKVKYPVKEKVYIYAGCDVFYGSYYIEGLRQYFGKHSIRFSSKKFPDFKQNTFALLIPARNGIKKVLIDYYDSPGIDPAGFDWCDIYAKVNLQAEDFENPARNQKLMAIGPGFGIRIWNGPGTIFLALSNFIRSGKIVKEPKKFFICYLQQYRRPTIKNYQRATSEKQYVFSLHTLWKKSLQTNLLRAKFIRACRQIPSLRFEGGFAPRKRKDIPGYEAETAARRYGIKKYLDRTRRSALVFSSPAVLDCHGWKLGEFFALGKAILSVPLTRLMPGEVQHKKQLYILADNDFQGAVERILADDALRNSLENNAYAYYCAYLQPVKVIARILEKANQA